MKDAKFTYSKIGNIEVSLEYREDFGKIGFHDESGKMPHEPSELFACFDDEYPDWHNPAEVESWFNNLCESVWDNIKEEFAYLASHYADDAPIENYIGELELIIINEAIQN